MKVIKSRYKSEADYILLSNEEYEQMTQNKEITKIDIYGDCYDNYFQRYRITLK